MAATGGEQEDREITLGQNHFILAAGRPGTGEGVGGSSMLRLRGTAVSLIRKDLEKVIEAVEVEEHRSHDNLHYHRPDRPMSRVSRQEAA